VSSDRTLLVVGLPGAGKTTFLAALWHLVVSAEVPTKLELVRLRGNREHLNRIATDWLSCRPVERTPVASETVVSMELAGADGASAEVFFPDMSGELFNFQWKSRKCSTTYYELAREAAGVLLFVHPHAVTEPVRIDEVAPLVDAVNEGHGPGEGREPPPPPWDPDAAPTQVKLVELLQVLARPPFERRRRRVALVVSAWDLVAGRGDAPAGWVAARLPLLDQYLRRNPERYAVGVYGVSAQGGDLGRDGDRLLGERRPAHRVVVVGDGSPPHDLTAPVAWAMARDD
jgi:hypothetical protein